MSYNKIWLQRLRPWVRRTAVVGVTVGAVALIFPTLEDAYWRQADPQRVWKNESIDSMEDDSGKMAPPKLSSSWSSNLTAKTGKEESEVKKKKNLVILGTGWAAVSLLKHIDRDLYNINIVSPRNYFLFTPLLPSVSSGTVSADAVTVPIRQLTSYKALPLWQRLKFLWRGHLPERVRYLYATATDIDLDRRSVRCEQQNNPASDLAAGSTFELPYDVLVVGTGATTNTFQTEGVQEHCHYLKETGDATLVRQNVLKNLEQASLPEISSEERQRLLQFWVVGGGPTAVEFAAELQDFLQNDVVNSQHAVFSRCAGATAVNLVQSNEDVLPGYPKPIRDFALDHMKNIGINVLTEARATRVTAKTISIFDKKTRTTQEVPQGLVVWATGVAPGPLAQTIMSEIPVQEHYRALKTDAHCRVIGANSVFAAGDCADIDQLAARQREIEGLYARIATEYPLSADDLYSNNSGLSLEGNKAFLVQLSESLAKMVSAPGAKIVKDLEQEFVAAKNKAEESGGEFRGLTPATLERVIQDQMKRQKFLPPTAQVAHQQGEYLADLLNQAQVDEATNTLMYDHVRTFEFQNRGQLVYVGGHMAALTLPTSRSVSQDKDMDLSWNGSLTNFVWHAAYFGMLESTSARLELLWNWLQTYTFGRSTALDAICSTDSSRRPVDELQRSSQSEDTDKKAKTWWSRIASWRHS